MKNWKNFARWTGGLTLVVVAVVALSYGAQLLAVPPDAAPKGQGTDAKPAADTPAADQHATPAPAGSSDIVYLTPQRDLWLDKKNKQLVMKGKVAVRSGNLEMLACPKGTKDYESIISVSCKAAPVHAGLLALGAKPGHPSKFDDSFHPANGPEIEVIIRWKDANGKPQEAKGQEWIKNVKTGKTLEYPWVFGGSVLRTDPDTGEKYYLGDSGDFICVANFPTAMMDLPIESPR